VEIALREAKARLAELVAAAEKGERVIITKHGRPAVEVVRCRKRGGIDFDKLEETRRRLGIEDAPDNANNRYDVATAINAAYPGLGPFWGRPSAWDYPAIPTRASARAERDDHPPERRIADHRAKGAKTVWQLAYAGSVGSQMLLGLPALKRLVADPRIVGRARVWPFETGLRPPDAPAVIAEVYPSLLRNEVGARRGDDEILDSAQVRVNADAFARLDAGGGLAPLFAGAPRLTPGERWIVESEEAWILGLGHEEALKAACRIRPDQRRHE